jgi:hypothetical protein
VRWAVPPPSLRTFTARLAVLTPLPAPDPDLAAPDLPVLRDLSQAHRGKRAGGKVGELLYAFKTDASHLMRRVRFPRTPVIARCGGFSWLVVCVHVGCACLCPSLLVLRACACGVRCIWCHACAPSSRVGVAAWEPALNAHLLPARAVALLSQPPSPTARGPVLPRFPQEAFGLLDRVRGAQSKACYTRDVLGMAPVHQHRTRLDSALEVVCRILEVDPAHARLVFR